ncbi:cytochrome c biogenesis protein CcdA [Aquifex aeolicus]|uniref:Cytochrome c-type biogenesis protein n=1 Tax=Aquifex aeolicus (strain VF5) TaxID=224324 RepID=O66942_AQUAE|nr:cytochrome c biogenesis protein CcdA [Aquifex aeolicus]AAC06911.1 cytochrome c-type biogenesis protein [Aquifex aeolicus VF5]
MDVTVISAFLGGLLSFLSPCILPIIPAYLSYISGVGVSDVETQKGKVNWKVFFSALYFVLGFTLVFTGLGASATFVGQLLHDYQEWIIRVGSGLVIFFGLHFAGVFLWKHFLKVYIPIGILIPVLYFLKLLSWNEFFNLMFAYAVVLILYLVKAHEFLYRQLKIEAKAEISYLGAFLMGVVFAFGWSPCIGPVLGSILFLASQQETVAKGALLLFVYSIGLGIPFLLAGLLFSLFLNFVRSFSRYFKYVEIAGGVLLVSLGLLLALDKLSLIANITF